MGRMEFNRQYNTEEGINEINNSLEGVVHSKFQKATSRKGKETGMLDLSESPQAYKDIADVINNELDLITPVVKLRPLICMKG